MAKLASEYSLEQMKDDIALFVANAYLQVLFNKENLKVIQAQHQITLEQLDRAAGFGRSRFCAKRRSFGDYSHFCK